MLPSKTTRGRLAVAFSGFPTGLGVDSLADFANGRVDFCSLCEVADGA
jgi:hypothetical protein